METHRDPPVTGSKAERGTQATASAHTGDADLAGVDTEISGVRDRPPQGRLAVVDRGRVGVLGGQAVLDGNPDDPELRTELVHAGVVHRVGTGHIAATVDGEQARQRSIGIHRSMDPNDHGRILRHRVLGTFDGIAELLLADETVAAQSRQDLRGEVRHDLREFRIEVGMELGCIHQASPVRVSPRVVARVEYIGDERRRARGDERMPEPWRVRARGARR